jgi:hypothetical protein
VEERPRLGGPRRTARVRRRRSRARRRSKLEEVAFGLTEDGLLTRAGLKARGLFLDVEARGRSLTALRRPREGHGGRGLRPLGGKPPGEHSDTGHERSRLPIHCSSHFIVLISAVRAPSDRTCCAMIRRAPCNVPKSFRTNVTASSHRRNYSSPLPIHTLPWQAARRDRWQGDDRARL